MDLDSVPIIKRAVLFGNPDRAGALISPDGTRISYLAPVKGVANVWVAPIGSTNDGRPVTSDRCRGVRVYFWAFTNRHILYLQDTGGDENWHLYAVDIETGETKDLTPIEGVQASVTRISHKLPEEVVVGLNDRDPRYHDLYRINILSGQRKLVRQNPEFSKFVVDDDYTVRFAMLPTPDGGQTIMRPAEEKWERFDRIEMEDSLTTGILGFNKTGDVLYMRDSRDGDTGALVAVNLKTGSRSLLGADPKADAGEALFHPTEKTPQAVSFTYERKRWRGLEAGVAKDLAYLHELVDGDLSVPSRSLDDRSWLVSFIVSDSPVRYYHFDRGSRKARFLFTHHKELEDQPLTKLRSTVIMSRDGLDLVSYYALPPGSDSDDNGVPDEPLPMVLFVHGGPWSADRWVCHPHYQWITNRGYAVLAVNFRGSVGFGKAFVNAGDGQWAGNMHNDLVDGVNWAVARGIADPERIAIMGGSYGGYSTLVGLTFTPETFACGVDLVGPSNLVTLLESIPPYWEPEIELFTKRVGDHRTEEGRKTLERHSPLSYVDRICRPLLIGQGANDPRVKRAESDRIVKTMQEKNLPVTYVLYPDEGHGFARPENKISFNAIAEAFLARCLGGRCEPIGDAFSGSTVSVPAGAQHIAGLTEKLEKKERRKQGLSGLVGRWKRKVLGR